MTKKGGRRKAAPKRARGSEENDPDKRVEFHPVTGRLVETTKNRGTGEETITRDEELDLGSVPFETGLAEGDPLSLGGEPSNDMTAPGVDDDAPKRRRGTEPKRDPVIRLVLSLSRTVNLGDFESASASIMLSVPTTQAELKADEQETLAYLQEYLAERTEEMEKVKLENAQRPKAG